MVAVDLSHLPENDGTPFVRNDKIVSKLMAAAMRARLEDDTDREKIGGHDLRASYAGACTRNVAWKIAKQAPSDPLTLATYWRFATGQFGHDLADRYLPEAFPGPEFVVTNEAEVVYDKGPYPIGAHVDHVIEQVSSGRRISVETKTVGGYKFKLKTIGMRGKVEPADWDQFAQGCIGGVAADADEVHLMYLALENISQKIATDRGFEAHEAAGAEWMVDRATAEAIALAEATRLAIAIDEPTRAVITDDLGVPVEITNPTSGSWVDPADANRTGSTWRCDYCEFRTLCRDTY